jgi:ubiquinone/menaquinone biosynthesis C-methylase UbiE
MKINVISMDISLINVEKALKIYPFSNHFGIVADAFHLPFADNSIDCIIASEIIEHVIEPKAFVDELFRCIKQNGSLIITTPYKEKLQYYLCVHCNNQTPKNAHIHSFDENKLINLNTSKELENTDWFVFGNKLLLFSRSYFLLRILNFKFWRIIDKFFNLIYNKPVHILIKFMK